MLLSAQCTFQVYIIKLINLSLQPPHDKKIVEGCVSAIENQ